MKFFHGSATRLVGALPTATLLILTTALCACSTYGERVAPVPLPESFADHLNVEGALLSAQAYVDEDEARAAFGFDIRGAGLLAVRFVIDNQSGQIVKIFPHQTFLIDQQNQAWPLLTAEQAYQRVTGAVRIGEAVKGTGKSALLLGAAGAIAGFAIGMVAGENLLDTVSKGAAAGAGIGAIYGGSQHLYSLEDRVREDLARKTLRNQRIMPGELVYGFLFFPGKDEASSAGRLRLAMELDGRLRIVNLPFKPVSSR
jgi:hypothetical protein